MTQRNPFKKDDRVVLRPGIKKQGARHGIISARPNTFHLVSVRFDGNRTSAMYHVDLLEPVETAEDGGIAA